jgi:transposase
MSKQPIAMLQIRRILQLLEQGKSKREISRVLHSGRHTIDGYVSRIGQTGMELSMLLKLSDNALSELLYSNLPEPQPDHRYEDLKPRLDYLLKELNRTGVTKLLLWQEYSLEVEDAYSYPQFCTHLTTHAIKRSATMHFEHKPGERVQIDFAGKHLNYVDNLTGEIISCPVLVCVLPYSGYSYVEALSSASQEHLFAALGRCMSYFGGVPQNALSDNMKQFVFKSNRYEPVFSNTCEQWSVYYSTTLSATRVAKPKDKPSVENLVHLTYMRIYAPLRDKTFYSLQELNEQIFKCLHEHNRMPFQKRSYSRYERFIEDELPLLKPLPAEPFILKHTTSAKVQKNYHVILGEDWHQYSVPYQYLGKETKIVYDSDEVEIYLGLKRIAIHKRNYRKHGYTTLPEHMPEKHQRYHETRGWDADYFLNKANELGENSFVIMERILAARTFTEQAYRACQGLLRLSVIYGHDRFENACKRAVVAHQVSYKMINDILKNNLDMQTEDQFDIFTYIPDHENIRGPEAYH